MKEFYELPIWRAGYELLMKVYNKVGGFPSIEKYALSDQLTRAANSVIANIAESHGRYYFADKIRVLYIVRGEISEVRSHLAVACGQGYISKDEFTRFNRSYCQLAKDLNSYINSLNLRKSDNLQS